MLGPSNFNTRKFNKSGLGCLGHGGRFVRSKEKRIYCSVAQVVTIVATRVDPYPSNLIDTYRFSNPITQIPTPYFLQYR